MVRGPPDIANKLPRSLKAAVLAGSLMLSAMLTALALCSPDLHWLAWISFLPLFVVIRSLGCPVLSRGGGRNRGVPHSSRSEVWGESADKPVRSCG